MSDTLSMLKELYLKAKSNNFEWKPLYPNNMPNNGIMGIYTDMFIKCGDNDYMYLKYSIQYCHRVDAKGYSHPEEPVKYYVLHELREHNLQEPFEIPEPTNEHELDSIGNIVNNFGRFLHVFDDEETAKSIISSNLRGIIYPYTYILSNEEGKEWTAFLVEQGEIPSLEEQKAHYEALYPKGTRLRLLADIDDPYDPKEAGDILTVTFIDDRLQIHGRWQSGGSIAILIGHDSFEIVE